MRRVKIDSEGGAKGHRKENIEMLSDREEKWKGFQNRLGQKIAHNRGKQREKGWRKEDKVRSTGQNRSWGRDRGSKRWAEEKSGVDRE